MLLFLSDIAGSEILLILVFILIFFGSKSIPGIAKTMGRTMRQIRDASQDVQNEIKKSGLDIKKDLNLRGMIQDTEQSIRQPLDQMSENINELVDSTRKPYQPTPRVSVHPKPENPEGIADDLHPNVSVDPSKSEENNTAEENKA